MVRLATLPIEARGSDHFFFPYHVTIFNHSTRPLRLISRRWLITDGDGDQREVRGAGVRGQQPRLEPGERFSYRDFVPLTTPVGALGGSFQMAADTGQRFDAVVEPVTLAIEHALH